MWLTLLWACAGPPAESDTDTTPPATLTEIQASVFTPSCAFSSCHGPSGSAASLDLTEGHAYGELVGVASTGAPDRVRVVPGDPDASYLVAKLAADADIVGEPMPSGDPDGLDPDLLERVRSWIADGASDD